MVTLMPVIRGLMFNFFFYSVSTFLFIFFLPILLFDRSYVVWFTEHWTRMINVFLKHFANITYEVRGIENLPSQGACIIAAKHQSAWDTFIYHQILKDPIFVMKKELTFVPIYSWYTRALQMIVVNRKEGGQALIKMIRDARKILNKGKSIVIFPEGTRAVPYEKIPYQPGIAALYKLGFPIIPAATNSGAHWGRRGWLKYPGKMVVEFLPEVPQGLSKEEVMTLLQRDIDAASVNLLKN